MNPQPGTRGALAGRGDLVARRSWEGRYLVLHAGRECGEERWQMRVDPEGIVVVGDQEMVAPYPFPNRQEFRVTLTPEWRVLGVEILWSVGPRRVTARHEAEGGRWRARVEIEGHAREQEGDYPNGCEVDFATHLFSTFILARRDFSLGGEHEFPVLRIGPPYMAVSPERALYRCVEIGTAVSPLGPRPAKRYTVSTVPAGEEGYSFWADAEGIVLASYEDLAGTRPWMRLVELRSS